MERLLLFTIGSVQEYIIESKKVVDLINSSLIISDVMQTLKAYIEEKMNGEILLPYIEKSKNDVNVTNQILITYKSDRSMASELEDIISNRINKLLQKKELKFYKEHRKLKDQLEDMLSVYWVEIPIKDENEYEENYRKLVSYLEAVKYTNSFINIEIEEAVKGEKCSVCGKRNCIFHKNNGDKIKAKEMLCGVCYLKRIYKSVKVDSTAQIALEKWIEKNREKDEYKRLKRKAEKMSRNSKHGKYQLLYKENMLNEIKRTFADNIGAIEERETINLYEELSNNQEKYYCIYRLDIDNLGKWISGQYKTDGSNLREYQRKLSQNIHDFLSKIAGFFSKKENCKLVYAGGDDVLALLNIEDALELSKKVDKYFEKAMANSSLFKNISFSQGIFIVHYKGILRESLKLTKERLNAVKEKFERLSYEDEKNAFIISVLTDGYFYKEFYFKNHFEGKYIAQEIDKLIKYFRNESSFFHNELANQFENMDFDYNENLDIQYDIKNMLMVQQRRFMKRSNKSNKLDEKIDQLLIDILNNNRFEMDMLDLKNYLNMFYIIEKIKNILGGDESDESIESNS